MKNKVINLFKEYSDYLLFCLNILIIEILVRSFCHISHGKMPLIFNLLIILLLFCFFVFIKYDIRKYLLLIFSSFISFYGFAQTINYAFFTNFFSFKKLSLVGELYDVMDEVFKKIYLEHLIFILPVIFTIIYILIRKKKKYEIEKKIKYSIILMCLLLSIISTLIIKYEFDKDEDVNGFVGDRSLHISFYNSIRYYRRFGILDYIINDAKKTIFVKKDALTEEEIIEIDEYIKEDVVLTNEMTGKYEGKNFIMILCESLSYYPINEELTPTLYKMVKEGTLYTNNYAPIFQTATGDNEFISQTSLMPSIDYGVTAYDFIDNAYPYALANLFEDKGYHSNSYHSFYSYFYNRENFHPVLGFEQFYDLDKLQLDEKEIVTPSINWIDDNKLFTQTMIHTNEEPFYDFIITTSGHQPYADARFELRYNKNIVDNSSYGYLDDETKYYLASQIHFNNGLAALLEALETKGILDNTIICLYGDHYPYGISTKESYDEVIKYDDYHKYKTPLLIYDHSNPNGQEIDTLSSLFDIYPTICNLFNLDYDDAFVVGKDLNGHKESIIYFGDRSILTDDFYYDATDENYYPLSNKYNEDIAKDIVNNSANIYRIGQNILRGNYYK